MFFSPSCLIDGIKRFSFKQQYGKRRFIFGLADCAARRVAPQQKSWPAKNCEKLLAIYRLAEPSTDTHPPTLMQVPVPGTWTKPAPKALHGFALAAEGDFATA
jgi:hypothetical protein